MKVLPVTDAAFAQYGRVVDELDYAALLETLVKTTPKPQDGTVYAPGDATLEALPIAQKFADHVFGGMPVQVGYCNGNNHTLNALEYHRGSEVNVAADDVVVLLAPVQKIKNGKLDTAEVEAFLLPAGKAVLLYETTLHYAPCNGTEDGFRVVIVLPKDTNTEKPDIEVSSEEDKMLWARNKWLLAHPASPEAAEGAYVGLTGENLTV